MGGIGQNCSPTVLKLYVLLGHKTDAYQIVTKYVIFCELWEKMSVPDIKNLGLLHRGGGGGAGRVPDHDSQRKKTPFHISRGK